MEHTLSPRMHNAAFRAVGLDMIYLPFEVKSGALKGAVEAIRELNLVGINLTQPHKTAALDYLDELSDEAGMVGAVNAVVNRNGTLVGYNTDGKGFVRSLSQDYNVNPHGKRIVLFGAGGAARALCWAVSREMPERLVIVNRTFTKAEEVARKVGGHALRWDDPRLEAEVSEAHIVVNAASTSLNLHHSWASGSLFIYDIAYAQKESPFVRTARERGAKFGSGLSMLLHQGAEAFELWTGRRAPLRIMRRALWEAKE